MRPPLAIQRLSNRPPLGTSVPVGLSTRRRLDNEWLLTFVQDEVVLPTALGEVSLRVVDDLVGAERPHQLHVSGAAHGGHVGAERLGDLHGEGADAS